MTRPTRRTCYTLLVLSILVYACALAWIARGMPLPWR